jgi:hypothetical protein
MKKLVSLSFLGIIIFISSLSLSYQQDSKCEGPAELCSEVEQLNLKIEELKNLKKENAEKVNQENEESAARSLIFSAMLAIGLRQLLQVLKSWKGFFETDKQKATLKIITIAVGVFAFIFTNIGMGISWWQSLILALGGPAAMAVDSSIKLVPVFLGQKKYHEVGLDSVPPSGAPSDSDDPNNDPQK